MNQWIHPQDGRALGWLKPKISCLEAIDGDKRSQIQRERRMTSGKSSVLIVMRRDILLAIVPKNSDDPVSSASGNHALALAATAEPK